MDQHFCWSLLLFLIAAPVIGLYRIYTMLSTPAYIRVPGNAAAHKHTQELKAGVPGVAGRQAGTVVVCQQGLDGNDGLADQVPDAGPNCSPVVAVRSHPLPVAGYGYS